MTHRATDRPEQSFAPDRGVVNRASGRRRKETHKQREQNDIAGNFARSRGINVNVILRRRIEPATRIRIAFVRENIISYTLFHVVSFAAEYKQRFILSLPAKSRN